ncbi:hypothetical protein [Burkholderia lata]|uniref:hypothetical protein n=1 Tax=Burkholderia lata (strain ATCC 17760 / DSM 23089 / LMG 22485 / NCIMB 9086 / R18194 / 383) TaxID=482957 RepID=UPI0012E9F186|nr:hypothetical protein [Burkholderia lata]
MTIVDEALRLEIRQVPDGSLTPPTARASALASELHALNGLQVGRPGSDPVPPHFRHHDDRAPTASSGKPCV